MSNTKSACVSFTKDDLNSSTRFMEQLPIVMMMFLKLNEDYDDDEKKDEFILYDPSFIADIPRQALRIAYDWTLKEIPSNRAKSQFKLMTKTFFKGTTYEILVEAKL
jgi:hypothetical protein